MLVKLKCKLFQVQINVVLVKYDNSKFITLTGVKVLGRASNKSVFRVAPPPLGNVIGGEFDRIFTTYVYTYANILGKRIIALVWNLLNFHAISANSLWKCVENRRFRGTFRFLDTEVICRPQTTAKFVIASKKVLQSFFD